MREVKVATAEPRYFVSLSGAWRESLPTVGLPSSDWKAKGCGWRYGGSQVRRERVIPAGVFYKLICDRCLPAVRKQHEGRQLKVPSTGEQDLTDSDA